MLCWDVHVFWHLDKGSLAQMKRIKKKSAVLLFLLFAVLAVTVSVSASTFYEYKLPKYEPSWHSVSYTVNPSYIANSGCSSTSTWIYFYNIPETKVASHPFYGNFGLKIHTTDWDNMNHLNYKMATNDGLDAQSNCDGGYCTVKMCGKASRNGSQYDGWSYQLKVLKYP